MKKSLYYIRIAGILLLICAAVAGMLAAVNFFTEEKIAKSELDTKITAIKEELFPIDGEITVKDVTDKITLPAEIKEVFAVYTGNTFLGYAVSTSGAGYGGSIELLVGISPEGKVTGVAVTSHTETKGLTDDAAKKDFLDGFKNSEDGAIDKMAGATISSRAITDAVNRVVSLGLKGEIK